jgi:glucuronate isomerase
MSLELRNRLYAELSRITLIDPHTHINPLRPASETLADILGYHYYTELAHSAGMVREEIEDPGLAPRDKVRRLMQNLGPIDNTIQYSWLVEMAREFFGFQGERITADNWEAVYDEASQKMAAPDWADQVLQQSNLEAVFLTNDFDDPLEGFDTRVYIPCLRTDDLVFHLAKETVRGRLERATNVSVRNSRDFRRAVRTLFVHFGRNNAKACAISLPPDFSPAPVSEKRADAAIEALWREGAGAGEAHRRAAANWVFWTLAEHCDEFELPFDLMIGVNRNVYPGGVHQGMDLYDSRVSLIQYRELFNAFPRVVFPISVLASVTNQELTSYAWMFPNVVTSGHWWYSNTPAFIEHDAAARLEAVPRTKQIAYYSDMYKLEFALPKFNMYKRILAKVLAERYVLDRGWSEERAVELGRQVLRRNVEEIFRFHEPAPTYPDEPVLNRSASFVGTQAEKLQPPTEALPAMREFTYWPQTASEGDDEGYQLASSAATPGGAEPRQEPPPIASPAALEDVEEVDLVEEQFSEEEIRGSGREENPPSPQEYAVSDEDLLPDEEPITPTGDEEPERFELDLQLEDEERRD